MQKTAAASLSACTIPVVMAKAGKRASSSIRPVPESAQRRRAPASDMPAKCDDSGLAHELQRMCDQSTVGGAGSGPARRGIDDFETQERTEGGRWPTGYGAGRRARAGAIEAAAVDGMAGRQLPRGQLCSVCRRSKEG